MSEIEFLDRIEWSVENPNALPPWKGGKALNARLASNTLRGHPEECWPWVGGARAKGYGYLTFGRGASKTVHRIIFRLGHGFWSPVVRHKCDYPTCVNLEHLDGGTQADNLMDKITRGRNRSNQSRKTHCPFGHPYSGSNLVITISPSGQARRLCRECVNRRSREYTAKRRVDLSAVC